ncbi:carboxylesterase/lipase family protein [Solimonas variicoloris]|uniref:carboxylesterase/lipase family protein n=1 Tax=Solimonas variicoloris TaxID=254408 RepID=UPI0009FC9058|nr:carboxylesterase family protein [Solimonas variicoloris]
MTTVHTRLGYLGGSVENGIHAFKGIPYAEPLQGTAKWLPPRPRRPWQGVLDASRYGAICSQFGRKAPPLPFPRARRRYFDAINGFASSQEGDDCLLLNVWTPAPDRDARLPVMVWIHGGSFTSGGANAFYDGTALARENVVAVTIQYRLGPLGFLHGSGLFDAELCSDNRAFQDQLAALQWIQDHIASFGGDPSRVTLFGESAGAVAVYHLAASPAGKGLFRRAIAMGGMPGPCAPAHEHHQLTRDALQDVGIAPGDGNALASLDQPALARLQNALFRRILHPPSPERYGSISLQRIVHWGAATETTFLPQPPLTTYRSGTPNNIDLLLGTCRNDGTLFSLASPLGRYLSARIFVNHIGGLVPDGDCTALLAHYRAHMPDSGLRAVYEQMVNDACFRMPTIRAAEAHAAAHPGKTYHYQLNYESAIPGLGAIHGVDVALLFRTCPGMALLRDDPETLELSSLMREALTTFARTGAPAAAKWQAWAPYTSSDRATMVIDHTTQLVSDLDEPLRRYWFRDQ